MEAMTEDLVLIRTSKRDSGSQPQDLLIREWFATLAETFDYNPSDTLVNIWIVGLRDLDSEMLARAFDRVLKTWKPEFGRRFPVVADIRAQLDQAENKGVQLLAEDGWERVFCRAMEHFHPDLGVYPNAPELPAEVSAALRCIPNGLHRIATCDESELQWVKKQFIEAYLRLHETRQVEHLLSDGKAKRVLATLTAGPGPDPARKTLAPATEVAAKKPSVEEVRKVFARMGVEKPPEEPRRSEAFQTALRNIREIRKSVKQLEDELAQDRAAPSSEEDLRRARDQQQRLEVWRAQHGAK